MNNARLDAAILHARSAVPDQVPDEAGPSRQWVKRIVTVLQTQASNEGKLLDDAVATRMPIVPSDIVLNTTSTSRTSEPKLTATQKLGKFAGKLSADNFEYYSSTTSAQRFAWTTRWSTSRRAEDS